VHKHTKVAAAAQPTARLLRIGGLQMSRTVSGRVRRPLRTSQTRRTERDGATGPRRRALDLMRLAAGALALVFCAAVLPPAGAQTGMKRVTDANNRFSIAFPPRWTVEAVQHNTKILSTEVPVSSLSRSGSSQSAMIGVGPNVDFTVPPRLVVIPVDFPRPITPDDIANSVHQDTTPDPNFQVTQDGFATIAGQRAYYLYGVTAPRGTTPSLYMVLAFFAQGREGFLVLGATLNQADRVRTDYATISAILETFRIIPQHSSIRRPWTTALALPEVTGAPHPTPSPLP